MLVDCPRHIEDSASQLFYKDKYAPEYKALLIISRLPHPQRPILASFVLAAVDHDVAAQFLLDEVSGRGAEAVLDFLKDWIALAERLRPTEVNDLLENEREALIWRQNDRCCFLASQSLADHLGSICTFIVSPTVFIDPEVMENQQNLPHAYSFIGVDKVTEIHSLFRHASREQFLQQVLLLSRDAFGLFAAGQISLSERTWRKKDSDNYIIQSRQLDHEIQTTISRKTVSFDKKSTNLVAAPSPLLLELHHRVSNAWSWMKVAQHMDVHRPRPRRAGAAPKASRLLRPVFLILQHAWRLLPVAARSYVCQKLVDLGRRLYGSGLSPSTHRLPFGLYLRISNAKSFAQHQVEFEALRLISKYTTIPAPKGIDTFQHGDKSYFLMTRVPGEPIGRVLNRLTDEQLRKATEDLRGYLGQMRLIPHPLSNGIKICNALGGGIFDWRIGETSDQEFTGATTADFHRFITARDSEATRQKAARTHNKDYDIVFTHADLNMRNILADESGTITGIVDWECAGWYPEYWEYTKAHFTTRVTIRWLADVLDQLYPDFKEELWTENMLWDFAPFL